MISWLHKTTAKTDFFLLFDLLGKNLNSDISGKISYSDKLPSPIYITQNMNNKFQGAKA